MNTMILGGIGAFLSAAQGTLSNYGAILTSLIGVAMLIVGVYQVAKNFISGGKGQTNWVTTICLIVIGGALALTSGWNMLGNLVNTTSTTVNSMANGSVDSTGGIESPLAYQGGTENQYNAGT